MKIQLQSKLMTSLMRLITCDDALVKHIKNSKMNKIRRYFYPIIPISSESHLNMTGICDLIWKLMSQNPQILVNKQSNIIESFCFSLISKNYNDIQCKIICEIVKQNIRNNNFGVFEKIMDQIQLRFGMAGTL